MVTNLESSDDKLRIIEALLNHGSPFVVYIRLPGVETNNPRLIDQSIFHTECEDAFDMVEVDHWWHVFTK